MNNKYIIMKQYFNFPHYQLFLQLFFIDYSFNLLIFVKSEPGDRFEYIFN